MSGTLADLARGWHADGAPPLWVVGAGGVGKSTVSCALALAAPAARLLSLDPAHSLADCLGGDAPRSPPQEPDLSAATRELARRVQPVAAAVLARGWFTAGEAQRLAAGPLPGLERLAAWEAALAAHAAGPGLLIDAPPADHLLELWAQPAALAAWCDAAALPAPLLAPWRELARRAAELLAASEVLIVSAREDDPEARRLAAAATASGLPCLRAMIAHPAAPAMSGVAVVRVPRSADEPCGAAALLALAAGTAPAAAASSAPPAAPLALAPLLPGRHWWFIGKGGTGKSTLAALAAGERRARGEQPWVASAVPGPGLADAWAGTGQPPMVVAAIDGERACRVALRWFARRLARAGVLEVEPGLRATVALGGDLGALLPPAAQALGLGLVIARRGARGHDPIVLDGPPTAQALEWLDGLADAHALLRTTCSILLDLPASRGLTPVAEAVAGLTGAFRRLRAALADPRAWSVVVAARPTAVVLAETDDLIAGLGARGLRPALVVLTGGDDGDLVAARARWQVPVDRMPWRGA